MTTYAIYAKPSDRNAEDAIFVPDAFSWGGFVFTGFWALWNRMWIVGSNRAFRLRCSDRPCRLRCNSC